MITTSERPDRRRATRIALVLSIVLNVLIGSLVTYVYGVDRVARLLHLKPPEMNELVTMSSAIRIEKRKSVPVPTVAHSAVPRPVAPPPVAAAPLPKPAPKPVETPRPVHRVRRELAKISPHHAPAPPPVTSELPPDRPEPPAPPETQKVALSTVHSHVAAQHATVPTVSHDTISPAQLASLDTQFRKTIAQAQAADAPIRPQKATPVTIKHYTMQFQGIHDGLSPGEGYIAPITAGKRIGDQVWYYTHYEFMNADGSVEQDDIPWPYHYPVDGDLFARGVRWIPLQPPPKGYVPNRPLKPQMQRFFPQLYPGAAPAGTAYGAAAAP